MEKHGFFIAKTLKTYGKTIHFEGGFKNTTGDMEIKFLFFTDPEFWFVKRLFD